MKKETSAIIARTIGVLLVLFSLPLFWTMFFILSIGLATKGFMGIMNILGILLVIAIPFAALLSGIGVIRFKNWARTLVIAWFTASLIINIFSFSSEEKRMEFSAYKIIFLLVQLAVVYLLGFNRGIKSLFIKSRKRAEKAKRKKQE